MNFKPTELPEVILVEAEVWPDERGNFSEVYHREKYRAGGIELDFVQDNLSFSSRGVLRGLHYQLNRPQAKLVTALSGEIFDVAVDLRRDSPTFKRWVGLRLSGQNKRQLFIPEGFAHGFLVLSETAEVLYKCSRLFDPADDRGIRWSDPALAIAWPFTPTLVSPKDQGLPGLAEALEKELCP
ncbi:MAG TPA: dTDP-4-dehydrorhamnose 3,5-epimerase [bacterium]|nr:dTDP-4-dehydrorhamnose 3,5-epimerase [bacterium]